jgi:hypothetical protein
LAKQILLQPIKSGVYDVVWGLDKVRLIVLSEIAEGEHNAIWRLFSAKAEVVLQAKQDYQLHNSDMSDIIYQLFEKYQQEKLIMAYTVQDFHKEYVLSHLYLIPPKDRLEGLAAKDRLEGLAAKDRLEGLSIEEIMAWLKTHQADKDS